MDDGFHDIASADDPKFSAQGRERELRARVKRSQMRMPNNQSD